MFSWSCLLHFVCVCTQRWVFVFLWWGSFQVWTVHYTQDLQLKSTHASSQSSGGPLRESQLWKVEQLGKLMAAPGDYRIQERPLFTVSPASPPPGDTEITASLLRAGNEQRPPCPPPKLIPPLPVLYPSFDFSTVRQQVSVATGNLSAKWAQSLAQLCLPPLAIPSHCSEDTELNDKRNPIQWEQL